MPGIGEILSVGRESAGLSREEMARTLRVPVSTVAALEEERWGSLPSPVYVRGFVNAWCRAAGMAPGPVLDMLMKSPAGAPPENLPLPGIPSGTGITVGARTSRRRISVPAAIITALLVALALAGSVVLYTLVEKEGPVPVAPATSVLDAADLPDDHVSCEPDAVVDSGRDGR